MCVSLGRTFVMLVITVLCIAISCSAEDSFTYTFRGFCCLRCMLYLIVVVKLGCFIILGWSNCWQDLKITEGFVQVIKGNMDLQTQVE
jgi:hypothetical protein